MPGVDDLDQSAGRDRSEPSPAARQRVTELQRRLEALRPDYEAARTRLAAPTVQARRELAWRELRALLGAFHPGDGGDKALFLLGRVSQLVAEVERDAEVLGQYEDLRAQIRKLEGT